jgi:hypothetical protein
VQDRQNTYLEYMVVANSRLDVVKKVRMLLLLPPPLVCREVYYYYKLLGPHSDTLIAATPLIQLRRCVGRFFFSIFSTSISHAAPVYMLLCS